MIRLLRTALSVSTSIVVVAQFYVNASAQSEQHEPQSENSLRAGQSALTFEVVGDFDLTSFDGANLSVKHHYADNRAYRLGVSVAIAADDYDASEGLVLWEEIETRTESIILTGLKLHYRDVRSRGSFYWGIGPRAMYSRTTSTSSSIDDEGRGRRFEDEKYGFGLLAALGVEWFIDEQISLLGQYGSIIEYRRSTSRTSERHFDPEFDYTFNDKTTNWILNPDVVRFGLSLYW